MLGAIIAWAVFGLIVGAIARFVYPGRVPMGCLGTMFLGIGGSLLGGLVAYLISGPPRHPFDGAGWILSILGALLLVWGGIGVSRRAPPPV